MSTAEYQQDDKHVLQKIEQAIHNNLIDSIYNTGTVPEDYEGWKTRVVDLDNLLRRRNEAKKTWGFGSWFNQQQKPQATKPQTSQPAVPANSAADRKDGTGMTYGGTGRPMELDKAQRKIICYNCQEEGHIARNCPKPRKASVRKVSEEETPRPETPKLEITGVRRFLAEMSPEAREAFLKEAMGFHNSQQ